MKHIIIKNKQYKENVKYDNFLLKWYPWSFDIMIKLIKFTDKNIRARILIIFLLLKKLKYIVPIFRFIFISELPKPTNKLNNGPAILLETDISPYPHLASLTFNIKSGILFPKVKIEIPINECGIWINSAISFKKETNILQVYQIHNNDIANPQKHIIVECFGSSVGDVL